MSTKYTKENPYIPQMKLHESLGNEKIGKILNTNLQAGDDDINGRVAQKGSCCGCCDSCKSVCYARDAYRYDTVIEANADNLYYAEHDMFGYFQAVIAELLRHPSFSYHRWHSSGEIPNRNYIHGVTDTANSVSGKKHYIYTKRYSWINEEIGDKANKPSNLSVLFSPPFNCNTLKKIREWAKVNNPYDYPLFIYDDGTDPEIGKLPHCPAVNKEGHKTGITCDKCGRCPNGLTTAVYAH